MCEFEGQKEYIEEKYLILTTIKDKREILDLLTKIYDDGYDEGSWYATMEI